MASQVMALILTECPARDDTHHSVYSALQAHAEDRGAKLLIYASRLGPEQNRLFDWSEAKRPRGDKWIPAEGLTEAADLLTKTYG